MIIVPPGPGFTGKLCLETLEDLLSVVSDPLVSIVQSGADGQPEKGTRQGPRGERG